MLWIKALLLAPAIALLSLAFLTLINLPLVAFVRFASRVAGEKLIWLPRVFSLKAFRRLRMKVRFTLGLVAVGAAYCLLVVAALTTGIVVSLAARYGAGILAYFLWILPFFALFGPAIGLRYARSKARRRVRYLVESGGVTHAVARAIVIRRMSLDLTKNSLSAILEMALLFAVGSGVFFAMFYESEFYPDKSSSAAGAATVAFASCLFAVWLGGRLAEMLLRIHPADAYAIEILESIYLRPNANAVVKDPLGCRRVALLQAASAIEKHSYSLDAMLPKGVTNAYAALLRAGAGHMRDFCESRDSLEMELPNHMVLTVDRMVLLLSGAARNDVYGEVADLWRAFGDEGEPVAVRSSARFARLKEILLSVGRSVEPAGRATQTLIQLMLILAIVALVFEGRLDLVEVVKRVLQ